MTRKDYELIARAIRECPSDNFTREELAKHFAWAIREHDNRHFNIDRFLAACASPGGAMRPTHTTHAK